MRLNFSTEAVTRSTRDKGKSESSWKQIYVEYNSNCARRQLFCRQHHAANIVVAKSALRSTRVECSIDTKSVLKKGYCQSPIICMYVRTGAMFTLQNEDENFYPAMQIQQLSGPV